MWWGHTYTYILRLWGLRVKGQIEDQPGVANDTMRMNKRTNHSFLHPKSITVPLASDLSEVCTMIRGCPCIRSCLFLFHRMRDGEERGLQKSVLRRVQLISVQDTDQHTKDHYYPRHQLTPLGCSQKAPPGGVLRAAFHCFGAQFTGLLI